MPITIKVIDMMITYFPILFPVHEPLLAPYLQGYFSDFPSETTSEALPLTSGKRGGAELVDPTPFVEMNMKPHHPHSNAEAPRLVDKQDTVSASLSPHTCEDATVCEREPAGASMNLKDSLGTPASLIEVSGATPKTARSPTLCKRERIIGATRDAAVENNTSSASAIGMRVLFSVYCFINSCHSMCH